MCDGGPRQRRGPGHDRDALGVELPEWQRRCSEAVHERRGRLLHGQPDVVPGADQGRAPGRAAHRRGATLGSKAAAARLRCRAASGESEVPCLLTRRVLPTIVWQGAGKGGSVPADAAEMARKEQEAELEEIRKAKLASQQLAVSVPISPGDLPALAAHTAAGLAIVEGLEPRAQPMIEYWPPPLPANPSRRVPMKKHRALAVNNAQIHGFCVQVDSAIILVLFRVEFHSDVRFLPGSCKIDVCLIFEHPEKFISVNGGEDNQKGNEDLHL